MLSIGSGKGEGCSEAVLGKRTVAVEIIVAFLGIIPATYQILMLTGVFDHLADAFLAETVLRLLVGDHQALGGLAHRCQVKGESLGIHLAHDIDDVGQFLIGDFELLSLGLLRKTRLEGQTGNKGKKNEAFHNQC